MTCVCMAKKSVSFCPNFFPVVCITPTTSAIESFLAGTFLCNFHWCSPVWKSAKSSLGFQRQILAVKHLDLALLREWWHSGKLCHAEIARFRGSCFFLHCETESNSSISDKSQTLKYVAKPCFPSFGPALGLSSSLQEAGDCHSSNS